MADKIKTAIVERRLNGDVTVVGGFEGERPKIWFTLHADGSFFIRDPEHDRIVGIGYDYQSFIDIVNSCYEVAKKELDDNLAARFARSLSND